MTDPKALHITTVYDNLAFDKSLRTDWGFSCLVRGLEKTLLFDTGADGGILLDNLSRLDIPVDTIDAVILSHEHRDHCGGLSLLLERNADLEVWMPGFFSDSLKNPVRERGARLKDVSDMEEICPGAHTTGVITGWISEQSLLLESPRGPVLITGCAHPRITKILSVIQDLRPGPLHLAMGGFHLGGFEKDELRQILSVFRKTPVERLAPSHCTGEDAIRSFRAEYGADFIEAGVGKTTVIQ